MIEKCPIRLMGQATDDTVAMLQRVRAQVTGQGACLAKVEPRAPRHERRRVPIADVAEKIRFHTCPSGKNSSSEDSYLPAAKNSPSSFAWQLTGKREVISR